ncbi:MAG: hypothetical protein GY820_04550, partial [Gammaproteobacteria bacterium]|nr:hypothetical protein [Gammaproteobacteria bacterium]
MSLPREFEQAQFPRNATFSLRFEAGRFTFMMMKRAVDFAVKDRLRPLLFTEKKTQ